MADSLAPADVEPLLRGRLGRPYRYAERCASTQRLLARDAPEGAVAVADEQTEGRGRLGRSWHAPPRTGLLLSVRLLPDVPGERLPELTVVAAHAVADAVDELTGLEPLVKEPNDVLVGGRKVAGVLAEATDGRVTLGVGVNVNQERGDLPADARLPATSLRIETGRALDRARLLATLLARLERRYDAWLAGAAA